MLRDALNAPARTDDAVTTVFMGGLLVLVSTVLPAVWLFAVTSAPLAVILAPFVIFPPLVLRGYYVSAVRVGLRGDDAAPSFLRWSDLVRDGAKSVLLSVGYLLPVGFFVALAVGLAAALATETITPESSLGVAAAVTLVVAGFGAVAASVLFLYLRPAALTAFAASGRLRDAFSPRAVGGVLTNGRYTSGWGLATVVLVVGVGIGLPMLLAVIGVFLVFYARVTAHVLYGRGGARAIDDVVSPGETEEEVIIDDAVDLETVPKEVPPAVQTGRTVHCDPSHGETAVPRVDGGDAGWERGDGGDGNAENSRDGEHRDGEFQWGPVERSKE